MLFVVYRSGDVESPIVVGSSCASRLLCNVSSTRTVLLCPLPRRLIHDHLVIRWRDPAPPAL